MTGPPVPFSALPLVRSETAPKRLNAWGAYGADDEVGFLNRQTPSIIAAAASSEIKTGIRVPLDASLDFQAVDHKGGKPLFHREPFVKNVYQRKPAAAHDDTWTFNPQSSTQWDGLRHFGYQAAKRFYNDVTVEDIAGQGHGQHQHNPDVLGIHNVAKRGGITGRGVLVDFARWATTEQGRRDVAGEFKSFEATDIKLDWLKKTLAYQGTELRFGDILIVRSGFFPAYRALTPDQLTALQDILSPGLGGVEQSDEVLEWIWNNFSAVAGDHPSFERWPTRYDWNLHEVLLGEEKNDRTADEDEVSTRSDHVNHNSADTLPLVPDPSPGSLLSSPRSESSSVATPPRSRSLTHRPFDRRFHTRLASSPLASPRALSPAQAVHSRQSSLASLGFGVAGSEADESTAPWDVIRWHKLSRITAQVFSETAKRNFGHPTCIAVTDTIVIGTSKGLILVFDHQQVHKTIIGPGTKAVEHGAISALAISTDHSTVAAGHATGHIFTWEIGRPTKPFLAIPPIDISLPQGRRAEGHVSGCAVVHIGFLGYRRTALVSADDRGMAFSHLATRGLGAVGRTVKTARILGRYPDPVARPSKPLKKSSVLAFSALPLGNVERRTDAMGLVAMLTPYLLVIVSTTPIAQTQHKAARPRNVAAHSAMTAALAWFPSIRLKGSDSETSKVKLAYAWSNVLTILEVDEVVGNENAAQDKPAELQFLPRSRFQAEEAIVAIQWLSRSVLAVLTITQQLLILEDVSMNVSDSFDLLPKNVYHVDLFSQQLRTVIENLDEEDSSMHGVVADAFHMSFRAYKGRLFLLGFNDIWWGSLTNWADRLLALMEIGDFIAAIRLATRYYEGHGEKLTIGLPEDDAARARLVGDKLFEMMNASLKYAFGKNQQANNGPVAKPQMAELAEVCINACLATDDLDFLFDSVFPWYEDHDAGPLFVDVLEPYILDHRISSLPPPVIKMLIDHFATTHDDSSLEEIICMLDTTSMGLDQVTTLCKKHNLYDAYIYVWNKSMNDFVTPLEELLQLAAQSAEINGHSDSQQRRAENAQKIFPYLSFILTSRTYPTGLLMDDDQADAAKSQAYNFFFSALPSSSNASSRVGTRPYANLRQMLNFDTPAFFSMLNEAFEDSFLNPPDEDSVHNTTLSSSQKIGFNRQLIVKVLLDVMASGFDVDHTIYLDIFIARNLPKYTQYMLLPGTTMQDVFTRLCHYPDASMREDAELSIEYLLAVYQPSNLRALVPLLYGAEFYRVLKGVFRKAHQYAEAVDMYFKDPEDQDGVFDVLHEFLRKDSDVPPAQQQKIIELVKDHVHDLIALDVHRTAETVDRCASQLHRFFLDALEDQEDQQFEYLSELFEPAADAQQEARSRPPALLELYIRLMCRFNADHVPDFVDTVKEGDLRLDKVLPTMEQTGIIDAAVMLEARSGHVKEAIQRLNAHLASLDGALRAIVESVTSSTDSHLGDAVQDILGSISKYARVGIFLCRSQTKSAHSNRRPVTQTAKRSGSAQLPLSFDEQLWLSLIETVVGIARHISQSSPEPLDEETANMQQSVISSLRTTIQSVFTALLASATSISSPATAFSALPRSDDSFLRILRAFISNQAKMSPSLSELRSVFNTIFSAYAHEESLLRLSNKMLDKDVFERLEGVKEARVQGWRPRGWGCEVCRKRAWGAGVDKQIWEKWQTRELARQERWQHRSQGQALIEGEAEAGKGKGKGRSVSLEEGGQVKKYIEVKARAGEEAKSDQQQHPSPHLQQQDQGQQPGMGAIVND
ncbi:hypothetical protein DV735_g5225, partial [Chaetothyriales sp. CBS 134920]